MKEITDPVLVIGSNKTPIKNMITEFTGMKNLEYWDFTDSQGKKISFEGKLKMNDILNYALKVFVKTDYVMYLTSGNEKVTFDIELMGNGYYLNSGLHGFTHKIKLMQDSGYYWKEDDSCHSLVKRWKM
jgi:hypothetical protein